MRILYYFPELSTPMSQWQRIHFIDELSRNGIRIDVFNPLLCRCIEEAQECVIGELEKGKYDLFMTCLCNERHIFKSTIETISQKGIPTLSFRPDNLAIPYNDKDLSKAFDLLWLTSRETQYLYQRWGANTIYAPYAANPFTYTYNDLQLNNRLCFIGNPHGSRARIINTFAKWGIPIDMYHGKKDKEIDISNQIRPNWTIPVLDSTLAIIYKRLLFKEGRKLIMGAFMERLKGTQVVVPNECLFSYPGLSFNGMIDAYSKYALSLSFTSYAKTDILKNNLPVLNLRNFEIPMCGGIQLCRYSEEMNQLFEDGKEVVLYRDEEEMIDKAKYYLYTATEAEIRRMKSSARFRAEKDHTWMNRFKTVFDELALNKQL